MRWCLVLMLFISSVAIPSVAAAAEPVSVPPTAEEYRASLVKELDLLQTTILLRYQLIASNLLAIEHAQWPWEIEAYLYEIAFQRLMISLDLERCAEIRALIDAIDNGV